MFETLDHAEVTIPLGFAGAGERLWQFVTLRIHVCWFFVVYSTVTEDNLRVSRNIFLTHVDDLVDLTTVPDIKIVEVHLVSPKHINKKGEWKMERVEKIWIGQEPDIDHEQYTYVYALKNGSRYMDSSLCRNEEKLKNKRIVFGK